MQGDVTQIRDVNNNLIASYVYDAWGKVLSVTENTTNNIGAKNAIRYRGYYYDTESNLYYLNARYYDPQIKRFISADGTLGANSDMFGYNLYAYCGNNPVVRADYNGEWWIPVVVIAIVAVVCCVTLTSCSSKSNNKKNNKKNDDTHEQKIHFSEAYNSADEAALAASKYIAIDSFTRKNTDVGYEYGSIIYYYKGNYYYTSEQTSRYKNHIYPDLNYGLPNVEVEVVAFVHTHPTHRSNNNYAEFSEEDTSWSDKYNKDLYMVNQINGKVKKYKHDSGHSGVVIGKIKNDYLLQQGG